MSTDCLFCRLLRGDLPSYRVYEDDLFTVLLTIYPINPGHLMVVTNQHIESFYEVEDDLYGALMLLVKRLALVIKTVFTPLQVVMETSGVTNRHVHIHVLPVYGLYDRVPREVLEQQLAQPAPDEDLTRVLRELRQSLAVQRHD
jgi:histidine triad (HIT) family protein